MRTNSDNHATASFAKRAASLVLQVVTFSLQGERYAVPISQVQEVILCQDIARSFEMPDDIVGIYNLRGTIIPIVDLRRRLNVGGAPPELQLILVCRLHTGVVGFIVDEVHQVLKIPRSEIKQPPQTITARTREQIIGIATLDQRLVTIIDIAAGERPASEPVSEIFTTSNQDKRP
jgi:purine-binding chemotaxis protein CheW